MGINSTEPNGPEALSGQVPDAGSIDVEALSKKYAEERDKRQRADGVDQYEELEASTRSRLHALAEDPFVDHELLNSQPATLVDGQEVKVLILGAGFSGLLSAARLIEAGLSPDDLRLVDSAGGFGGTWYWNRYPGVMCDTEASVYCPLLEETGYMPKHKYSYGEELRGHTERIARHYGFADKGVFRTTICRAEWDEDARRWHFGLEQYRGPGQAPVKMNVSSQFFIFGSGPLNHPKAPKIPGLSEFRGEMFHTARWDYNITGGTPSDQTLEKLDGKRVGIMGTGATAVQAIPKLAAVAKELFVFQRTPSTIGIRNQQVTDPVEWETKIAAKKGWSIERRKNFELLSQDEPANDEYQTDGWTKLKTFAIITGQGSASPLTEDEVQGHIDKYLKMDVPYQDAIRRRVEETVKDRETAEALKPWYPTWCKRPGFHDEYLDTFNLPHVHLIDTSGSKGIRRASEKGLVVDDKGTEIGLDVLILATGFRPLISVRHPDPGARANMTVVGRGGLSMADKWAAKGPATLHGMMTASFPNFSLTSPVQSAVSSNYTGSLDAQAENTAYVITESLKRASDPNRVAFEVNEDAEEAWVQEVLKYSLFCSPATVCTPGYFNSEREIFEDVPGDEQARRRRNTIFARGLPMYRKILGDWRADGKMDGISLRG